jgi:hypothetical protein
MFFGSLGKAANFLVVALRGPVFAISGVSRNVFKCSDLPAAAVAVIE